MSKNQNGSILIWVVIAILVIGAGAGGWFYLHRPSSNLDQGDPIMVGDPSGTANQAPELPSPSPDYSLVQQKYGLNQQQIDTLSHVVKDDGSKL
jgi:hypothetical protein